LVHSVRRGGKKDVLEVCETVELACAKLYHNFADLFKDDRECLLLWLKTATEEENHARLFALVRKLRRNDIIETIQIDSVQAREILLYVRSLIKKVRKNAASMEEALQTAIQLEVRMNVFRTESIIKFSDHSFEKLFLEITGTDSNHLEALKKAYARVKAA